jgi:hypothetical protein
VSSNDVVKFPYKRKPEVPVCPACRQPASGSMVAIQGTGDDKREAHLHEACYLRIKADGETMRADAATRILASVIAHLGGAVVLHPDDFKRAEAVRFEFTTTDQPGDLLELRLAGVLVVPPSFGVRP